MKYLVSGTSGPGFQSPDEAKQLLEGVVHPSFVRIQQLEAEGKISASGLPIGDRTIIFVLEAASHSEADSIIQSMPIWPLLEWEVVALQSVGDRMAQEKQLLAQYG